MNTIEQQLELEIRKIENVQSVSSSDSQRARQMTDPMRAKLYDELVSSRKWMQRVIAAYKKLLGRDNFNGQDLDGFICDQCFVFLENSDSNPNAGSECQNCGEGKIRAVLVVDVEQVRKFEADVEKGKLV